jgi:hypothetical protein
MGAVLGHAERGITVSKAITILSVHAQNAIGMATIGNDRAYEEYLALEMGIQALQKQLVDRIPCEWCAPETTPGYYVTAELPGKGETSEYANFCPMCGRRLPEANQNGTL